MNFLRKTAEKIEKLTTANQIPNAEHGRKFTSGERLYSELEKQLRLLLGEITRYNALWGEILQCKVAIYGRLLWFYGQQSQKRILISDLFKYHTKPMEKYVNRLRQEYEDNLIGEIVQILKIFPETKKLSSTLSYKKHQWSQKNKVYNEMKQNKTKNISYTELAKVDEEVRRLEHTYEVGVRTVIREFDEKIKHKDCILDRFCIRMFESDSLFYTKLFKTSRVLNDTSLKFQYHRSYPKGLPSFFRDYKETDLSSDSDIDFEQESLEQRQILFTHKLCKQYGFKQERVEKVIKSNPNASYEKILELLTNIKSKKQSHSQSATVSLEEYAFRQQNIAQKSSQIQSPQTAQKRPPSPKLPNKTRLSPSISGVSVDSDGYTIDGGGYDAPPPAGPVPASKPMYVTHKRAKTPPPATYKKPKLPPTNNKNIGFMAGSEGDSGDNELDSDDEELSVIINENVDEENIPPPMEPQMIKTRSYKRYKTVDSSLRFPKKTKSANTNNGDAHNENGSFIGMRGRARSKSIDDRDGNIRRKRVHKTPPPPPRNHKRPKKYSMNDMDDADVNNHSHSHSKRSQTIDLKQYMSPNDFSEFKPPQSDSNKVYRSNRISDELFSRRKKKKLKKNQEKKKNLFKRKKNLKDFKQKIPKIKMMKKHKTEEPEQRNSDKSSGSASSVSSISPEIPSSNTHIVKETNDSEDSLNEHRRLTNPNSPMLPDTPDEVHNDWPLPESPSRKDVVHDMITKSKPSKPTKPCPMPAKTEKKSQNVVPKYQKKIAELYGLQMKNDKRVIRPWTWSEKYVGEEGKYRYYRNKHPLGLDLHSVTNFDYLRSLFGPMQTRHTGDPNSSVQPNKIGLNEVIDRSVNIRKLRVDSSTADLNFVDEKIGIHNHKLKKQKTKVIQIVHQNKQLSKQNNVKRANTPSPKIKKKKNQHRSNSNPSKPSMKNAIDSHHHNSQKAKPYKQRNPVQNRKSTQPQSTVASSSKAKTIQPLKTAASMKLHQHQ